MKWKVISYILLITGVVIVLGYLVFALIRFSLDESDIKCKNLIIDIEGKIELIKEGELNEMLRESGLHPIGMSLNQLPAERIERFLEQNPLVKKAVCYHTPEGCVFVKVALREPKFLVMTNENYYVDHHKEILPVPLHAVAYVPVVTGRVTRSMATGSMFEFVDYIEESPFWDAQISQIHVREDMKVELVPRVGSAMILLGSLDAYEEKLNRVYRLYNQGFKVMGWNRYKKLDLQYDNQIVGIKK
ncbi:MAG: cell division protein FtsQ/DivIB [Paludibacter sp.]|nr:cell division protein FtsQ/DivIB [Paludibacter sp.]MDD4198539.1 cell division protein FtsQ/DivIB [Paludibacter sp.]MDD4428165.1 cell division protein FtsQ/DivIB [Paludibacter sp.]